MTKVLKLILLVMTSFLLVAFDGICPECKKHGMRSTVYRSQWTSATLMGTYEYWDEDGNYHYVDPNYYTTRYSCSNGHEIVETEREGKTIFSITVTEEEAKKKREKGMKYEPYLSMWLYPLDKSKGEEK